VIEKNGSLVSMLKKIIDKRKTVGIMENVVPYRLAKNFGRVRDISKDVYEMRMVKDSGEIASLKKSCKIANGGICYIRENLKKGMSEKELALGLEREMISLGAEDMSFPTIVTSGKRSSHIHPFPSFSGKRIGRGLGLVDFGAISGGYCSDVTVPFGVGKLTEKEKKIRDTVLDSYENSLKKVRRGVSCGELYDEAERVIKSSGFRLMHGLGHGIGLEVHDYPSISPGEKTKIRDGMVFTIEPGVYVRGTGGMRIENDVMVHKNKAKVLTKSRFLKI